MTAPENPSDADADVDAAPAETLVGQAADQRAEVLAAQPDSDLAGTGAADVEAGDAAFDRGADPAS